jgi:hypothetical protein
MLSNTATDEHQLGCSYGILTSDGVCECCPADVVQVSCIVAKRPTAQNMMHVLCSRRFNHSTGHMHNVSRTSVVAVVDVILATSKACCKQVLTW